MVDCSKLSEAAPCIYLILGCTGDEVSSLYVGKTSETPNRTLQHMKSYEDRVVPAAKEKRLKYHYSSKPTLSITSLLPSLRTIDPAPKMN